MNVKSNGRATCALLALLILLSCVSCTKTNGSTPDYDEDQGLDIIPESITYSDEFIANANVRFANISCSLIESYIGAPLDDKQKQSVSYEFKKTVIPMTYRVRIYEDELDAILSSFEAYIEDDGNEAWSMLDLYERCLTEIGSTRSGKLTYEISLFIVERKEKNSREKYEEYQYDWYLEDAERCCALFDSLELMGEEKFVSIISMTSFLTSLTRTERPNGESAFELTDADLLSILDHQGDLFLSQELSEDDFSTFGALIQELIPKKGDTLEASLLYVLKNNGYFPKALKAMPSIISLYAATAKRLNAEGKLKIDGDEDENARALASALLFSADSIYTLNDDLLEHAATASNSEKDAINALAKEEFASFTENTPAIDVKNLMDSLDEISKDNSLHPAEKLHDSIQSYLFGIAPFITFVFYD